MKTLIVSMLVLFASATFAADQPKRGQADLPEFESASRQLANASSYPGKVDGIKQLANIYQRADQKTRAKILSAIWDSRKDTDQHVQDAAFSSLCKLEDPTILIEVYRRLKEACAMVGETAEPPQDIRQDASRRMDDLLPVLYRMRPKSALPVLHECLGIRGIRERHPEMVLIVGRIGGQAALDILNEYLKSDVSEGIRDTVEKSIAQLERAKAQTTSAPKR